MTPKEKAIELVNRFQITLESPLTGGLFYEEAKFCALIAVEVSLSNFAALHKPEYTYFDIFKPRKFTFEGEHEDYMHGYDMMTYWQEVKAEIEKL